MVLRSQTRSNFVPTLFKNTGVTTERQSGFLPVGLSQNSRNGVETHLKYYFNFRSDLDATLGVRHLQSARPAFRG